MNSNERYRHNHTYTTVRKYKTAYMDQKDRIEHIEKHMHVLQKEDGLKKCENFVTIFTDEERRLLYCYVPKVGSTFWIRVLDIIIQNRNVHNPFDIPRLQVDKDVMKNIRNEVIDEIDTSEWVKFLFVRNPYERLLSTYIDKFVSPNKYYYLGGMYFVERYRANASTESKTCGHDVSFPEFIEGILSDCFPDGHWCPIYKLCRLQNIKYSFIGKMETFSQDAKLLLNQIDTMSVIKQFGSHDTIDDVLSINIHRAFEIASNGTYKDANCSFIDIKYALKRVWTVLKLKALIDYRLPCPFVNISKDKITPRLVRHYVKQAMNGSFTKESRQDIQTHVLLKAFESLSSDLRRRLREKFKPDFILFGYNDMLDNVSSNIQWEPF